MSFGEINSLSSINIPNFDKLVHIGLYFVLSTMWSWALYKSKNKVHITLLFVFLVSITIGVLIEYLQEFCTEVRTFEVLDIYANTTGALLGVLFFYLLTRIK